MISKRTEVAWMEDSMRQRSGPALSLAMFSFLTFSASTQ